MIKIHAIGGYDEVGKNMTALQVDNDVLIFDCGLHLPPIVELEEKEKVYNEKKLRSIGALPDDLILDKHHLTDNVRAILISHAHLDHVGALPYIANRYKNAEIAATPFTLEVFKSLLHDNELGIRNKVRNVLPNSCFFVEGARKYKVEFINVTHSTLQAALIAVHTPKGVVLYANDFKFDNSPILGKKPNYERLEQLKKQGVFALVVESLYSAQEGKTPSEKIARTLLEDVLMTTSNKHAAIVVTTFSSHIARIKSIVDFGKLLGRKIVLVGRSLNKYVGAANNLKLVPFMKDIEMVTFRKYMERRLKVIDKNREKYLIVCTGHQGEPGSILDRMARNELPFKLQKDDHVIFSSKTIPTEVSIANRSHLEKRLKAIGVRIFSDVHVSGHAYREDMRDFIKMVQPKHIIPAHGDHLKLAALSELSTEIGYSAGKNIHVLQNGRSVNLE